MHYQLTLIIVGLSLMVVHGDKGRVHLHLKYTLHRCLCKPYGNTFQTCLTEQRLCLKFTVFRCLMFHKQRASPGYVKRPLCGVINTGNQLMAHMWHIAVPSIFSLYINFRHFNLPMAPNCKLGTKVTVETTNNNSSRHY